MGTVPEANARTLAHPPEESLFTPGSSGLTGLLPGSGLQRGSNGCVLDGLGIRSGGEGGDVV